MQVVKTKTILGCRQAVRHQTLTLTFPGFESLHPSQKILVLRNEDFFIHCESNGISSRVSVHLITEGVYHQPQAVFAFAMMIYNASH